MKRVIFPSTSVQSNSKTDGVSFKGFRLNVYGMRQVFKDEDGIMNRCSLKHHGEGLAYGA